MAGIYIHIPFCKQKCSYCNFHFSTNLSSKTELIQSICNELLLRKTEADFKIDTLYLGGGTPSLLDPNELDMLFDSIYKNYKISENPEITIEANPDDLTPQKISQIRNTPINRFSIGIQSFFDLDLKLMNRAHNASEALNSVKFVQNAGFENITIDLIYGGQTTTDAMWQKNLDTAINLDVPHISAYALTIEPKTLLFHQIKTKQLKPIDDSKQERQYRMLEKSLSEKGFIHYEISNFGKPGFLSKHNSSYWNGQPYLGFGPSAHSYNGKQRSWNIANNALYIEALSDGNLAIQTEELSQMDRFNEMVMIRLRTIEGLDLKELKQNFPIEYYRHFTKRLALHLTNKTMTLIKNKAVLTEKGKFLADGIASDFFILD